MLAVPRHLNCRGKTTRKYADRPKKKKNPSCIKWSLRWLDFCKYQLLDPFLGTFTHQKQNTGLRNRALESTPQPSVKRGFQLCVRLSFSYQTILVCIRVPSGSHLHRAPWVGRICCRGTSQGPPQQEKPRQMLWTSTSTVQPAKQQNAKRSQLAML